MSFSGFGQQRSIDSKVLQTLLEDNFKKDTMITVLEEIVIQQDSVIVMKDRLLSISNLQIANANLQIDIKEDKIKVLNTEIQKRTMYESLLKAEIVAKNDVIAHVQKSLKLFKKALLITVPITIVTTLISIVK